MIGKLTGFISFVVLHDFMAVFVFPEEFIFLRYCMFFRDAR